VHPQLRILSQNNKTYSGTNESVKIVISLHCVTLFFWHVKCRQPTTAKMYKIFIAQKSYCACRVLSLATIRSKFYFNFILNRTTSGRELFDRHSYGSCCIESVLCSVTRRGKMIISDLEEKIVKTLSEGGCPFLVAATAGTTVLGSFDPFNGVADVCDKYNVWFHVDVRCFLNVV